MTRPLNPDDLVRGQFRGYRQEDGVAPDSRVETFAAVRLSIDSWRWEGVPFFIRAGKCLAATTTEVLVKLRRPPLSKLCPDEMNYVRFRLGPEVTIAIGARVKQPGDQMLTEPTELKVVNQPEGDEMGAYERLLGDAMAGDATLFARQDAVEAAWAIVQPILGTATPLDEYQPGGGGPAGGAPARGGRRRLALPGVCGARGMMAGERAAARRPGGPDHDPDPRPTSLEVLPTNDALMHAAAELWVSAATSAIVASGRFTVALSGGSTPESLYRLLATDPYASGVDWSRVHAFWGDERCVAPDDPASNYRRASEALLARVPIPAENIHRIRGEDEPAAAAAVYELELRVTLATPDGPPRLMPGSRFDLILLGMGEDGHTASLFPGTAALREPERWVRAVHPSAVPMARVTLTPALINAAAEVAFLVSGPAKAAILRRVLEGPYQPDTLPAQIIGPRAGHLRWLVDADAAADLESRGRDR
ncbi:MAG: 6-phosphogluconolactonase, partial [Dehalococcoidia bacterium]